jgi:hypothetical protein
MSEPVDRLEQLWAVHQIRQLAYKYAYSIDSRDWDLLLSLWVPDRPPVTSPAIDFHSMSAMPPRWTDFGPTTLFVGNHLIELDSAGSAHGVVYCFAQMDRGEEFVDQAVVYHDQYERRSDNWLFVQRRHLLWWGERRAQHPMQQSPADWPKAQVGAGVAFDLIKNAPWPDLGPL